MDSKELIILETEEQERQFLLETGMDPIEVEFVLAMGRGEIDGDIIVDDDAIFD